MSPGAKDGMQRLRPQDSVIPPRKTRKTLRRSQPTEAKGEVSVKPSPGCLGLAIVLANFLPLVPRQERPVTARELGRLAELLRREVRLVAAERRVVMKLLPRDRMDLGTHAQKAAKRGHGVHDMPAHLFDDEALDGPDLLPVRVVNGGALNVITLDQWVTRCR